MIKIHKSNSTLIIMFFPKFKKALVLISKFELSNEIKANIYASYALYPNSWISLDD